MIMRFFLKKGGSKMYYKDNKKIIIMEHPLIKHKISLLRDETTGTTEFRQLVEEIAMLEAFEAFRDLPLKDQEVKTPIETCMTPMIDGKKMAIVPILRAGLGMVNGVHALVPSAKVGHIGLYMNHTNIIVSSLILSIRDWSYFSTRCLLQAAQPLKQLTL